ncbi:L,D-transpeptidase family protein [Hyphomicrobium sp. LHD-15]|uniref:L,D-transpeptidase family protein n=1 Tax=Hyphomicrobium sp. LHD-15 TaxID=3072142 RepID=UPI00280E8F2B|nr:L,D-transpeptidase family protein [Hyphomicrobium sp. LHD-15]MDQ8697854.1 L,D-transpeptidase family protein [Hyphomicrobium sp. LHD-15]
MLHRFRATAPFCVLFLSAILLPSSGQADPAADTVQAPTAPVTTAPAQAVVPQAAPSASAPAAQPTPPAAEPQPQAAATVPPAKPLLGAIVRARLDAFSKSATETEQQDALALKDFYVARNDAPLWIADGALNDRAVLVIAEIKQANNWGLDASAFELPDVSGTLSEDTAADAELKLSIAALTYARHARGGRIADPAKQLSSYLDRVPQLIEPKVVLAELAGPNPPDKTLRGFHPQHPQFEKLRQKYLELLKSAHEAEEIVRLPKGPALSPGQSHPHIALLRQRLNVPVAEGPVAEGTPEKPADANFYDDALAQAVKAFQTEKGLTADGIVGGGSRAALNDIDVPNPDKLRANLELWRWIPADLGPTYVWVNLPEFMFEFVREGKIVHEERIIAGLVDKQTPVFSAVMDTVTIHPRWNVPDSIKVRELYPSLARGGTYFQKQGLRMTKNGRPVDPYNVDWSTADIRQFDVQQPPGGANVLGQYKFTFHNKHIVYMHDTPTKNLFNQASRPFSHGCMRIRNPGHFAEVVLDFDKGWTPEKVAEIVNGEAVETPIALDKKIPVHVAYFTQWVDDAGELQSFKDVYGHEQRVMLALAGRFDAIARGPDHLAPVRYEKREYASGGTLDTFFNNLFGGF